MSSTPPDQDNNYLQVLNAALSLYGGNMEAAERWMANPVKGLGGRVPMNMLATKEDTERVLEYILRLEHGIVL